MTQQIKYLDPLHNTGLKSVLCIQPAIIPLFDILSVLKLLKGDQVKEYLNLACTHLVDAFLGQNLLNII